MDGSQPGSPVHGILQARRLEWVAISFCRGSSQPREDQTQVSCIAGRLFTVWTTREYTRDKVVLYQKRKDGIGGGGSSKAVSHNTTENLFLEMHSQRRNVRQTILRVVKRMERLMRGEAQKQGMPWLRVTLQGRCRWRGISYTQRADNLANICGQKTKRH